MLALVTWSPPFITAFLRPIINGVRLYLTYSTCGEPCLRNYNFYVSYVAAHSIKNPGGGAQKIQEWMMAMDLVL